MPNTYTQLYIHCVFAVRYRAAMLRQPWDEELRRYITGTVQNSGHKMIAINNMADHMHLFVGMNPTQSISDMMRTVKGDSSELINRKRWTPGKFQWQSGYGAFSHSRSQVPTVVEYLENQQQHHHKATFLEEYRKMLHDFDVPYEERYLFTEPE